MKKFIGYTVINTKTKNFVDYEGSESPIEFETFKIKDDAGQILGDIDWSLQIGKYDNKHWRRVRRNRKYFKIVPLYLVTK